MDIVNRIQSILEKEMSLKKLEEELGFGNGTIGKWKKSPPSCSKISAVAQRLDCSIDYLLGRTENPQSHKERSTNMVTGNYNAVDNSRVTINSDGSCELSIDESEIIRIFRQLNAKQRHKLMTVIFDMEDQSKKQEE